MGMGMSRGGQSVTNPAPIPIPIRQSGMWGRGGRMNGFATQRMHYHLAPGPRLATLTLTLTLTLMTVASTALALTQGGKARVRTTDIQGAETERHRILEGTGPNREV